MLKKHKIFTCCIIGALAFSSQTAVTKAEELPIAGIDLVLDNFFQNSGNETVDLNKYFSSHIKDQYEGISFAKVTNYVNIRETASEESKIVGKLYNDSAATVLEKSEDWYKVKSGSVTGYIKADFLITGEKAQQLAKETGTRIAKIMTTTLKVRKEASIDSPVLILVPIGDEFIVKKETKDWIEVELEGNTTGFLSAEFVEVTTEYEEAVSIEEEEERLKEEQAALQEEQIRLAAEREAISSEKKRVAAEETKQQSNKANKSTMISSDSTNNTAIRDKIVNYALQFEGNPYVWGGTSLTNGADCSGFTQSVFRDNGISIPRTSRTQAVGGRRISINQVQPGDLIFYDRSGTINHVGIYIGNGKVIAASSPSTGIRITNYNYRQPYRVVSYISD